MGRGYEPKLKPTSATDQSVGRLWTSPFASQRIDPKTLAALHNLTVGLAVALRAQSGGVVVVGNRRTEYFGDPLFGAEPDLTTLSTGVTERRLPDGQPFTATVMPSGRDGERIVLWCAGDGSGWSEHDARYRDVLLERGGTGGNAPPTQQCH